MTENYEKYNWFDRPDIDQILFDRNDDPARGLIEYAPLAEAPAPFVWPLTTVPLDLRWSGMISVPKTVTVPAKTRWLLSDRKVPTGETELTDTFFQDFKGALKDYNLDDVMDAIELLGTLGEGYSSTIIAISLSQEDGLYLVANKLGSVGVIESILTQPASGYEYYDGTSMATPHVSAVAALVWSADPTATNAEIRSALSATAEDLGTVGRDTSYGYGLVQAYDAIEYLVGSGGGTDGTVHVADLDATKVISKNKWTATVTVKVVDDTGALVSGAVVTGAWSGGYVGTGTCTTGSTGTCSMVSGSMKLTATSVTYTVNNVTASGFTYDASANTDPDGDSSGTVITIVK